MRKSLREWFAMLNVEIEGRVAVSASRSDAVLCLTLKHSVNFDFGGSSTGWMQLHAVHFLDAPKKRHSETE